MLLTDAAAPPVPQTLWGRRRVMASPAERMKESQHVEDICTSWSVYILPND